MKSTKKGSNKWPFSGSNVEAILKPFLAPFLSPSSGNIGHLLGKNGFWCGPKLFHFLVSQKKKEKNVQTKLSKPPPGKIAKRSVLFLWSKRWWPDMVISKDGTTTAWGKIDEHAALFLWSGKWWPRTVSTRTYASRFYSSLTQITNPYICIRECACSLIRARIHANMKLCTSPRLTQLNLYTPTDI